MIKWTTPTLKCTIPNDLQLDYVLLTLKQNSIAIEKRIEAANITDGVFEVYFTQEETGQFYKNMSIEAQLNIMHGETRLATNIVQLKITENLHDEVING